ncbi:hypothetical protein RRG08_020581 [Elysia crispata]|uniref:Uncharacterized protein n=1 Tax=Elysia crispata TaxID=231223 RepID=A0AAE1DTM3_9GAST|nr:hypothetical protein RRG08_020581 [Elysia crispata]
MMGIGMREGEETGQSIGVCPLQGQCGREEWGGFGRAGRAGRLDYGEEKGSVVTEERERDNEDEDQSRLSQDSGRGSYSDQVPQSASVCNASGQGRPDWSPSQTADIRVGDVMVGSGLDSCRSESTRHTAHASTSSSGRSVPGRPRPIMFRSASNGGTNPSHPGADHSASSEAIRGSNLSSRVMGESDCPCLNSSESYAGWRGGEDYTDWDCTVDNGHLVIIGSDLSGHQSPVRSLMAGRLGRGIV